MRRLTLLAAAVAVAAAGTTAAVAAATGAPAITAAATFTTETWYQPNPTCGTPAGCPPVTPPAVNVYGAGTLHVAVSAGRETARTYLTLAPVNLPTGSSLDGAVLTVPLDTTASAGSASPETSKVQVCTTTTTVKGAEGAFDDPPLTDCRTPATAVYSATPAPHLTADLAPLLPTLRQSISTGTLSLALLPAPPAATDAWHVVLSSPTRTSAPTAPATLALSVVAAATGTSDVAPAPVGVSSEPQAQTADPVTGAYVPPVSIGGVVASGGTPPTVASAAPTVAGGQTSLVPTASREDIYVAFQYPAVILTPLLLLAFGVGTVRVFSRELTVPAPSSTRPAGAPEGR